MNQHVNPILKGGPGPGKTLQDAADVYLHSLAVTAESLPAIIDALSDIAASLATIALYCERRGKADGVLSEEDFETPEKPLEP